MVLLKGNEGKRHKITVNGHEIDAVVSIEYAYEDYTPTAPNDFDYGDAKENAKYAARFRDGGDLSNVMVTVTVRAKGLEGVDHLGGCHIRDSHFETDIMDVVSQYEMISIASKELRKNIIEAALELRSFLKPGPRGGGHYV